MNSIYNHAIKQSTTVRKDLQNFEDNISNAPLSLIGQLTATLSQLHKTIGEYEESINKQYLNDRDDLKKEKNLNKLKTLQTQLQEFKDSFQMFKKKRDEFVASQSRQELFERRHNNNNKTGVASDNPYSANIDHDDQQQQRLAYEDGMLQENDRLRTNNEQLDHILEMAAHSYENLVSQNEFLSGISTKLSNSSINLRLSGVTLRKIEQKMKQDKIFFYGGCAVVIFCFYLILKLFG